MKEYYVKYFSSYKFRLRHGVSSEGGAFKVPWRCLLIQSNVGYVLVLST